MTSMAFREPPCRIDDVALAPAPALASLNDLDTSRPEAVRRAVREARIAYHRLLMGHLYDRGTIIGRYEGVAFVNYAYEPCFLDLVPALLPTSVTPSNPIVVQALLNTTVPRRSGNAWKRLHVDPEKATRVVSRRTAAMSLEGTATEVLRLIPWVLDYANLGRRGLAPSRPPAGISSFDIDRAGVALVTTTEAWYARYRHERAHDGLTCKVLRPGVVTIDFDRVADIVPRRCRRDGAR